MDLIVSVSKYGIELYDHGYVTLITRIPFTDDTHIDDALEPFWRVLRRQIILVVEHVKKEGR